MVLNAQGTEDNHFRTGTLTTESIKNHSDIEVRTISAGVSTDTTQMAGYAMSVALSLLGNQSEHETSTTESAISRNMLIEITDEKAQQQKTGNGIKETLSSLNRAVETANGKVAKQDLTAFQERQEATQIMAELGSKVVGDLAKQQGWEEGSPQKLALHGLVGYLSAKVGGGNTTASALSAMGSEAINTEIANYLSENTALTETERKAIQQASAAGIGALIGTGLGGDGNVVKQSAQMAVRTEQFNRQLHPDEIERIKELAQGDEEKQKRLEIAACALVHCSAQIPPDDPEYQEAYQSAKVLEALGNQDEFATERALLSKQLASYDFMDSYSGYRNRLFDYTSANKLSDSDERGPRVLVRAGGAVQSVGGIASAAVGGSLCETGIGCVAGVPAMVYGVDNFVAGAKTLYSGKNHTTLGAKALSALTGLSKPSAEMVYSMPSMLYGSNVISSGIGATGKMIVKESSQMVNATNYMVREVGRDIKVGSNMINGYVNDITSAIPHNKYVFSITDKIGKGIESVENITPKKYFQLATTGYTASSATQYIFSGTIDHSKSLKTGLLTSYVVLPSPMTGTFIGAMDTAIETQISGKNHLNEQKNYLKSNVISEMINNVPYINKHPFGESLKILNGEIINEIIQKEEDK